MQEHGIEGPYRNNAGYTLDRPMYLQYPNGPPPSYNSNATDSNGGPTSEGADPADASLRNHPSILRRRTSRGQLGRPRGESISTMAKRVDFSLGMRDIAPGDDMADVYDDRSSSQYRSVIRETNRIDEERSRSTEPSVDENGSVVRASGRSASRRERAGSLAAPHHAHGGLFRRSTEQPEGVHRGSMSSAGTHRNRFLDRFGRGMNSSERSRDIEAIGDAPLDPRSGQVTSQAVRMDSARSVQPEPAGGAPLTSTASHSEDFAMRGQAQQSAQEKQQ